MAPIEKINHVRLMASGEIMTCLGPADRAGLKEVLKSHDDAYAEFKVWKITVDHLRAENEKLKTRLASSADTHPTNEEVELANVRAVRGVMPNNRNETAPSMGMKPTWDDFAAHFGKDYEFEKDIPQGEISAFIGGWNAARAVSPTDSTSPDYCEHVWSRSSMSTVCSNCGIHIDSIPKVPSVATTAVGVLAKFQHGHSADKGHVQLAIYEHLLAEYEKTFDERDAYLAALEKIAKCKYDDVGLWLCNLAKNVIAQYDATQEKK